MDIINVIKTCTVYDTNLGLPVKEKRENVARTGGGITSVGRVMARGIEAYTFSSNISLRTHT